MYQGSWESIDFYYKQLYHKSMNLWSYIQANIYVGYKPQEKNTMNHFAVWQSTTWRLIKIWQSHAILRNEFGIVYHVGDSQCQVLTDLMRNLIYISSLASFTKYQRVWKICRLLWTMNWGFFWVSFQIFTRIICR